MSQFVRANAQAYHGAMMATSTNRPLVACNGIV
jgi:hypothetical protein